MKLLLPQSPTTTQVVFTYSRINGKIRTAVIETWAKTQQLQSAFLAAQLGENHEIRNLQTH